MALADGRVAILDYGLMTEIDEDKRMALIEYVAHLSAKDYEATLGDLVKLDFIPAELERDEAKRAIVAPILASVLEQLSQGGGAAAIDVGSVGRQIDRLAEQYPIVIPPYFGLIIRAFSTLEGIGLTADSAYSIVDECFPYLASVLLTTDTPRMRACLRTFVYGGPDRRSLRLERLAELANGLAAFSDAMAPAASSAPAAPGLAPTPAARRLMTPAARDVLQRLLAPGNYLQQLLLDEAVRAADGVARGFAADLWQLVAWGSVGGGGTAPASGALALGGSPLLLQPLLSLMPGGIGMLGTGGRAPASGLAAFMPLQPPAPAGWSPVRLSDEDRVGIATAGALAARLLSAAPAGPPRLPTEAELRHAVTEVQELAPLLPELAPGLAALGGRFASALVARAASRLQEDLASGSGPAAPPR